MFNHVVLINPTIPPNTGNIARTCIATQAILHLVGEIGFSMDEKRLKRAGLDYWHHLNIQIHTNWDSFLHSSNASWRNISFFENGIGHCFWRKKFQAHDNYIVFGSEISGIPSDILASYTDHTYHIPMSKNVRSLNLSNCVSIVIYEVMRQHASEKI